MSNVPLAMDKTRAALAENGVVELEIVSHPIDRKIYCVFGVRQTVKNAGSVVESKSDVEFCICRGIQPPGKSLETYRFKMDDLPAARQSLSENSRGRWQVVVLQAFDRAVKKLQTALKGPPAHAPAYAKDSQRSISFACPKWESEISWESKTVGWYKILVEADTLQELIDRLCENRTKARELAKSDPNGTWDGKGMETLDDDAIMQGIRAELRQEPSTLKAIVDQLTHPDAIRYMSEAFEPESEALADMMTEDSTTDSPALHVVAQAEVPAAQGA